MPLSVGDWIVCEQALTEVTINGVHFPQALNAFVSPNSAIWNDCTIEERISFAAIRLFECGVMTGPAKIIHDAYLKLCRTA